MSKVAKNVEDRIKLLLAEEKITGTATFVRNDDFNCFTISIGGRTAQIHDYFSDDIDKIRHVIKMRFK